MHNLLGAAMLDRMRAVRHSFENVPVVSKEPPTDNQCLAKTNVYVAISIW